jgi:hypothetical protein
VSNVAPSGGRVRDQRRDAGAGVHRGGRYPGDAIVGQHGVTQRTDHAGIPGDVDGDDQWAVDAGAEALRDEIVGPSLGAGLRQRTVVRVAHPQGQDRCGERQEKDGAADQVDPGVPGDVTDPSPPAGARRAAPGRGPADSEAIDPVPGKSQERGQQRDRRGHHDQHDDRDGDPARCHEREAGDGETEDRDDDGAAGEDDGPAGCRDGTPR